MRWKGRKQADTPLTKDDQEMDNPKKQSVCFIIIYFIT